MKKLFAIILSASLVAGLAACSADNRSKVSESNKAETTFIASEPASSASDAGSTEATFKESILYSPKDIGMIELDASQLMIDLITDEFDCETVKNDLEDLDQSRSYYISMIEVIEKYRIKYYKRFSDDRYKVVWDEYSSEYENYTYLKTDKGILFICFGDNLFSSTGHRHSWVSYSDDDTENAIKDLKKGQPVSDVKKIDSKQKYFDFSSSDIDLCIYSFHFYRRGVFYVVRYDKDGYVIDSLPYTM